MYRLMQALETKTFLGSLVMVIAYVSNSMHEVFVILAAFMVLDYITGIICGLVKNNGFNYKKGIRGALKKLSYLILILVTILVEFLIKYLTENTGFDIKIENSITMAVYIYLIGTEGLSIIQNLIILGIPVPPFMIKLFGW
ncbi:phage holin family protein [Thermoclostridium stercorarium]|uniref:phage holin family protein n=1 Tax=Thermoclostridium stercorarium TaxID=1510 RepID=UPI000B176571|nr:phage holin family protein [Thermoclostridium stercorarium]